MSGPLVSIVVPTYNRAGFVETAVMSLLDQDCEALEVIVLDDGSTDETPAVLERIAERTDPHRFRWSRHENVGQAATINRGFAQSAGELIGYLSSDDYLLPGAIAKLVAAAQEDPSVDVVYPWFHVVDDSDRVIDTIACLEHTIRDALRWALCMPGVGALMRRGCYERIGGWDERYRFCPDFAWWISARDARFRCVPEALGAWRAHDGSISTGALDLRYVNELLRVIDEVYEDDDVPPDLEEVRLDAYASAHALGALALGRGRVGGASEQRFAIHDRLAARYSHVAAAGEAGEIADLKHAYRAADHERRALRDLIAQQRLTIETLESAARELRERIVALEAEASGSRERAAALERRLTHELNRPLAVHVGRALTPAPLRPRLVAAVRHLRGVRR